MTHAPAPLPLSVLEDLHMRETYLDRVDACVFEADLVAHYGEEPVFQAIEDGILEHRRLPFRDGHERCICWLGAKGRSLIAG